MNLTTVTLPDGIRVRFEDSRLDAAVAIRFKDRLRGLVASHGPLIMLDLGPVEFMDSSGLGAILAVRRGMPDSRRIELTDLSPNVARVFRLTRMDTIFTIHGLEQDPATAAGEAPQGGAA